MQFPTTKAEAERIGSVLFYTGRPCIRGHLSTRYTKGAQCVDCVLYRKSASPDSRQRSEQNAKLALAAALKNNTTYVPAKPCKHGHSLRFTASNNCVDCDRIAQDKAVINRKYSRIKKEYGMSKADYLETVKFQESKCAICNIFEPDHFKLHVDHCHDTKQVRALLCGRCNQAIGLLKHDPVIIAKAAEYCEAI